MTKVLVANFSISLDGYGAGPNQTLKEPMGEGGEELHEWVFPTRMFKAMQGKPGGETGTTDERFASDGMSNLGAWILGRNMFGPVRGPWPDESWKGWWGEEPPYRCPVFVLTHHRREPLAMKGGTTFHFVTDGIHAALARAREAAGGKNIRIGGGTSTVQQYLRERLIDELHLVVSPMLLGCGEHFWSDFDLPKLGYKLTQHVPGERATHLVIRKDR